MQIGIVGLPYSGKTTLFETLLARKKGDTDGKFKSEAEHGVIEVPDERLDQISDLLETQSIVHTTIEYIKVPGLDKEGHKGAGLPGQFLANLKLVDLILVMIRTGEIFKISMRKKGKITLIKKVFSISLISLQMRY